VVAFQFRRAVGPVRRSERREGHHLAGSVAHGTAPPGLRESAVVVIALYEHALDAAAVDELVDERRPPAGPQRVVDVADRKTERARLFPIDVEFVLRLIVKAVRPYQADRR